jgi:hypothetical protein
MASYWPTEVETVPLACWSWVVEVISPARYLVSTVVRRAASPGVLTLTAQAIIGVLIYSAFIAVFDVAGLRGIGLDVIRALRSRIAGRALSPESAETKKAGGA